MKIYQVKRTNVISIVILLIRPVEIRETHGKGQALALLVGTRRRSGRRRVEVRKRSNRREIRIRKKTNLGAKAPVKPIPGQLSSL